MAWAGAGRAGAADASAEHAADAGGRRRQGAVGMLRVSGDCLPALMSALQRLCSEARGLVTVILHCCGVPTRRQSACCREAGTVCSTGLGSQVSSDVRGFWCTARSCWSGREGFARVLSSKAPWWYGGCMISAGVYGFLVSLFVLVCLLCNASRLFKSAMLSSTICARHGLAPTPPWPG